MSGCLGSGESTDTMNVACALCRKELGRLVRFGIVANETRETKIIRIGFEGKESWTCSWECAVSLCTAILLNPTLQDMVWDEV